MKLVFVIPEYRSDTSDHFYHLYQLIEKIAEDHQVALIAETGDTICKIKNLSRYKVQSTKDFPLKRLFERFFWFIELRLKGYKNFYCHYCEISTILLWLITLISKGTVYKWHCSQQDLYRQKLSFRTLGQKLVREMPVELSIRVARILVTCTPQMKMYFQKKHSRNNSSVYVLPNFICLADLKRKHIRSLKKPIDLLFVHRLSPRKGADRLVDFGRRIKEEQLPFKITVVGDGPLYESLTRLVKREKLEDVLVFKGKVPNSNIAQYYQNADLLLMPSRDEEFGRVQLEAMKYGVPILATKTLSTPFVLSKLQQQYVVSQEDYLQLLDNALGLINNPYQYEQLVNEGYTQVQQFSLREAVTNFNNLLVMYGKS